MFAMIKAAKCFKITASVRLTVVLKVRDQSGGETTVAAGYYQSFQVVAESVGQARKFVEESIVDGRVIWDDTSIEEEATNDSSRIGVVFQSGRALYPN